MFYCSMFYFRTGQAVVDVDGPGPASPALVTCDTDASGYVTVVSHSSMEPTKVDGFQTPGSFSQTIHYSAPDAFINHLLQHSKSCSQSLRYDCKQSKLFSQSPDGKMTAYGWWVSWQGQKMEQWAGGAPGSHQCHCGVTKSCVEPQRGCNCDSDTTDWTHDSGLKTR